MNAVERAIILLGEGLGALPLRARCYLERCMRHHLMDVFRQDLPADLFDVEDETLLAVTHYVVIVEGLWLPPHLHYYAPDVQALDWFDSSWSYDASRGLIWPP
jgi:hypothetical protein